MNRTTNELPAPLTEALCQGAPVFVLTNGADGFPNAALTYALALDAVRVRFCIDVKTATYRNLEHDARAALQIVSAENRVCLVKGVARRVRAEMTSKGTPSALFELQVAQVKDQAWRGVTVAPLTYEWDEPNRAQMLALEQAVFAEMQSAANDTRSVTCYLVRHGHVAHHQSDVALTALGRAQARAAGRELAAHIPARAIIQVFYSPVRRVAETAQLLTETLCAALNTRAATVYPPQLDSALENVRFIPDAERGMQEPSLLYAEMQTPEFLRHAAPTRAEFFRGFWASEDPMGYWLVHDSGGGAETPAQVLQRLRVRLRELCSTRADGQNQVYILVTHSGAMRVLLQDIFGADPGEPNFCERIALALASPANVLNTTYRGQTVAYALF